VRSLAFGAVFAGLLLGMSSRAALMLAAILVVSEPTVVGPLLGLSRRGVTSAAAPGC
jgi:NhaP-type Na+/H+ or K+/H+ antiporter